MDNLIKLISGFFQPQVFTDMPKSAKATIPSPSPKSSQNSDEQLAQQILAGYRKYNKGQSVPMEKYIPAMVEATRRYPIFAQNPYLIPSVSIAETSAGKNWQQNNNPLSWAARVQQAGDYNPSSWDQSIEDMITAVGGEQNRGRGYTGDIAASRQRQIVPYEKFRQSNNLSDFVNTYEPANSDYLNILMQALGNFQ